MAFVFECIQHASQRGSKAEAKTWGICEPDMRGIENMRARHKYIRRDEVNNNMLVANRENIYFPPTDKN